MIKHRSSFLLVLVLILVLLCYVAECYASTYTYRILNSCDAITEQSYAEGVAWDYYCGKQDGHILDDYLSSDFLINGKWILYSNYVQVFINDKGWKNVWFVSILDCRELEFENWQASIAIDDETQQVVFYTDETDSWFGGHSEDFLVSPEDPYGYAKAYGLMHPSNTFRIPRIPHSNEMSADEATNAAIDFILTRVGIQINTSQYNIDVYLIGCEEICEEDIWNVDFYDTTYKYPGAPVYKCSVYASHREVWYLLVLDKENMDTTVPSPYNVLYANNAYCRNTIDMSRIPVSLYKLFLYDQILSFQD